MLKKLFIAGVGTLFAATAFAVGNPFPASPSEGALGNWTDRDTLYKGKPVTPRNVPSSPSEGALGSAAVARAGQPVFQGTAALPTSIPASPSEGAIR